MKKKILNFYSIEDAIKCEIDSYYPFIIANERMNKSGNIGRYYSVFPDFGCFIRNRSKYPHCHEILVNHVFSPPNISGRLVFDFDIPLEYNLPSDFKYQIEDTIIEVIEQYCNNIDIEKLDFVWCSSKNPTKTSKHLTVKNLLFDNWIELSRIFYSLFCHIWDSKYFWIHSSKLIDFQIIKEKTSLRMPGSSKINGFILQLDNSKNSLEDSLIRIYSDNQERKTTLLNINLSVFGTIIVPKTKSITNKINNSKISIKSIKFNKSVYQKVFEMYNKIQPGIFKMGKINGTILSLIRIKSGNCILSSKRHDNDNIFCLINEDENFYNIRVGCYRFCYKYKTVYIGSISKINNLIYLNSSFLPRNNLQI